MKPLILTLLPFFLCACLNQEANRAQYDQEAKDQAERDKRIDSVVIYWTLRPDRPYTEIAPIRTETRRDGAIMNEQIKRQVVEMGGDAAIVTGSHSKTGIGDFTFLEATPYTDLIVIKWKP